MDQATRGVLTVARSVLEQLDTDEVLDRVLEAARELTGAQYAALGVLDESRKSLARFVTRGIDADGRRVIGTLPTGRGVLGELIRDPKPLRIPDVGSHPYSYGFPVGHPPMSSFLGVPIPIRGQPCGNLYLTEKQDTTDFTAEDEEAATRSELATTAHQRTSTRWKSRARWRVSWAPRYRPSRPSHFRSAAPAPARSGSCTAAARSGWPTLHAARSSYSAGPRKAREIRGPLRQSTS
jgi:signal transduction protein with GAF and PtsI domain